MSKHRLFRLEYLGVAFLIAGVSSLLWQGNHHQENEPEMTSNAAERSSGKLTSNRSINRPISQASEQTSPALAFDQKRSTKPVDRDSQSHASAKTDKTRFWRQARIPDDLISASLPVLQAARIPELSKSIGATSVSADRTKQIAESLAAFQQETDDENIDYKRSNEELFLWLLEDPAEASEWLSEQEDFRKFEMAFGLIADTMGNAGYPETGKQWTDLIPSIEKRGDALADMYAGMLANGVPIPEEMHKQAMTSDRID